MCRANRRARTGAAGVPPRVLAPRQGRQAAGLSPRVAGGGRPFPDPVACTIDRGRLRAPATELPIRKGSPERGKGSGGGTAGIVARMRACRPSLAAALLASLALGLVSLRAAAAPPTVAPPPAPETGFGATPTAFSAVERGSTPNPLDGDLLVHWVRPAGVPSGRMLPAVVFLHGFGAPSADPYAKWLEHIARQGVHVVYPVYPALESRGGRSRYDSMWAGVEAGLAAVATGSAPVDLARFGVVGHSFGGGAAPAIAARAAARGYGRLAMWIACFAPWYDLDRAAWSALPKSAVFLAVAYEDDAVCDPAIAASFHTLATTLPPERKGFLCFRSDDHGRPALEANHLAPLTIHGVDALDTRGCWRLEDALRAYALTGDPDARQVALAGGAEETGLGAWSDGTAVRPAVTSWPLPEAQRRRFSIRSWRLGGKQEELMRKLLAPEGYSSLPLPAPELAVASRLSVSERLVASPPAAPWPPPVAAALAKGPVLVLPPGDALSDHDRVSTLEAAGVRIVRFPPDSTTELGRALAKQPAPTAMFLARDGTVRLWKPVDDPHLFAALRELAR